MAKPTSVTKHHFQHSGPQRPRYFVLAAVIVIVGESQPPGCDCALCSGERSERVDHLPARAA